MAQRESQPLWRLEAEWRGVRRKRFPGRTACDRAVGPLEVVDPNGLRDPADELAFADRRVVVELARLVSRAVVPGCDLAERQPTDRLMAALHLAVLVGRVRSDRLGAEVQIGGGVLDDLSQKREAVVVHHHLGPTAVGTAIVGVAEDRVAECFEHGGRTPVVGPPRVRVGGW